MKKKVYLDTTIPSYYYDTRVKTSFLSEETRRWFREVAKNYEVFVSDETLVEAGAGKYPRRRKVLEFVAQWKMLPPNDMLDSIVSTYIDNRLMPQEYGGDALHLAYASFYKVDFLMTWNCDHLANANKRQQIRIINTRMGLFVPEIVTPMELF